MEKKTIELDCPPGSPSPDDLIGDVVAGTKISLSDLRLVDTLSGNYTWEVNPEKNIDYEKSVKTIRERITKLYSDATIRYGSW